MDQFDKSEVIWTVAVLRLPQRQLSAVVAVIIW